MLKLTSLGCYMSLPPIYQPCYVAVCGECCSREVFIHRLSETIRVEAKKTAGCRDVLVSDLGESVETR